MDNDRPDSKALLAARIDNLRLENQILKQKLRIDRPAYPPDLVEKMLGDFLNESHCQTISALNNVAYSLAVSKTTGECLKLLHEAQSEMQARMCQWMDDHKFTAPELSNDWPIPGSSFGWWAGGKWRFRKMAEVSEQKPTE